MTVCHGCHSPLEPLAQIRTYHTQCDPQGRVEMLERALKPFAAFAKAMQQLDRPFPQEGEVYTLMVGGEQIERVELTVEDFKAARAALAHQPAQIKGEGNG